MKSHIAKFIVGLTTICAIVTSLYIPAFAQEANKANPDIVEQYLLDAGYSQSFIDSIDDTIKSRLYEGRYVHQSTGTTYGVFTEDYQVTYTLADNGEIVIDSENMDEFEQLLKNQPVVERIIEFQELDAIGATMSGRSTESALNTQAVQKMPMDEALRSLTNWSADCVVSHKSYTNGVAKKELTYTWKWRYGPIWTLTDKVAVAWSGDFTADPDSIYWTYAKSVNYTGTGVSGIQVKDSGYGYDDYEPNAGCAVGIDIKAALPGSSDKAHSGSLSVSLTKSTSEKTSESAIGRYYHVKIVPGLSLGFSSAGPSISVTSGVSYDQSADSAASFWSTTSGKP